MGRGQHRTSSELITSTIISSSMPPESEDSDRIQRAEYDEHRDEHRDHDSEEHNYHPIDGRQERGDDESIEEEFIGNYIGND